MPGLHFFLISFHVLFEFSFVLNNFCSPTVIGVHAEAEDWLQNQRNCVLCISKWEKFTAVSIAILLLNYAEKELFAFEYFNEKEKVEKPLVCKEFCLNHKQIRLMFVFVFIPLIAVTIRKKFLNISCITKLLELSAATHFPDVVFIS